MRVSTNCRFRAWSLSKPRTCFIKERDILVVPDLDQIVASSRDKSSLLARARVGTDQATRRSCGGPADRVYAHSVGMETLVGPVVVPEFKNADMAI